MTAAEEEEFFKVPFDSTEVTEEWMCRTLLSSLSTSSPSSAKRTWLYVAAMQESGMLSSIFRARLDVTFEDGSAQEHKVGNAFTLLLLVTRDLLQVCLCRVSMPSDTS